MAGNIHRYDLIQDKKGMTWDLLLYVPTVIALLSIGVQLWFGPEQNWSYLLVFLGFLFLFIGSNRILKTRLMLLPSAVVALEIGKDRITMVQRNGQELVLVKDLKFFSEIGGKTFALTGMDGTGKKQQSIFHLGQFPDEASFKDAKARLEVYR